MDDCTFDDETASQWINVIEATKTSIRDKDIYPKVQSWVDYSPLSSVLEIGSGQGICSEKIDLKGNQYTGLEPSPKMTARAKELYSAKERNFVLGNVYALPFESNIFDGAFSILVWHLLRDLQSANLEVARTLKPGGRFLIITANPSSYSAWKAFYNDFQLDGKRLEGTMSLGANSLSHDVLYLHTQDELIQSFTSASLEVLKIETFRPSPKENLDLLISIEGRKI